jgi:hypothetical protein
MIEHGYSDLWKESGGKGNVTTVWANTRIDYIWGSEVLTSNYKGYFANPVRVKNSPSDHNLIHVDIIHE